ncbi:MAG: lysophospholipase [Alphaproteobacteria bacterium]|nr:MAG: lysophospholipase [Alphaproteobacteria bacterium]
MRTLLVAALLAAPAAVPAAEYLAPDYAQDASWLCRPGRTDACAADLATTSVAADGKLALLTPAAPAREPAIDCFYVYPTVSTDRTGNSDMVADPAETNVARVQFAAFRNVCRPFAPLYRQVTLKALRDVMTGQPSDADRMMAYRDVVAAWDSYLARDNAGRGVILIGHSQGSGVLKALLANAIEGKPAAKQLIAAYIPGHNVLVPVGKDVGGDLKSTPLCRSDSQTGCVLAWVSFRDSAAPPANSRFGRTTDAGMIVGCTNPAALAGGRGAANPLLPAGPAIVDNTTPPRPWARDAKVTTPFVALPGLLTAECKAADGANVLAIRTNADAADPRIDDIGGDVVVGGQVFADWGLHLIDVNVVQGDMIALAEKQGKAWLARDKGAAKAP